MKNVLLRIRELQNGMTDTKQNICQYIEKNPYEVTKMTIRDLARKSYSSPSTIVRFVRDLGFDSFSEFKQELLVDLNTLENSNITDSKIRKDDSIYEIINKVTFSNMQSLQDTAALLDENIVNKCVKQMSSSETILLFGMGSSYLCASDAFLKFIRLNKNCLTAEDWHTQLLIAKNATRNDIALIFSYSGDTSEMIEVAKALKDNKTPTFAVTRYSTNSLSRIVDHNLYVAGNESVFRKGAMSSRVSQLNIIDILFTLYINENYDKSMEQLIKTHFQKNSN